MAARHQRHHLVFHQRRRVEALVGQHDETHIHAAFAYPLHHLMVGAFVDAQG